MSETLSKVEREMIQRIYANPVLWAKAYLITYDGSKKEYTPWTARWYQAEMLQDTSLRKVYRCGRRTGGSRRALTTVRVLASLRRSEKR